MKKLISVIVSFVFVFCTLFVLNPTAYAYSDTSNDVVQTSVIEYLDNGDHIGVSPKFCVNSKSRCKIEQKILFRGLSPLSTL